ncbi:MAG: FAD-dependent oxidoreductase [Legionella sp.]|jgi:glycine oxidase
MRAGIVGAGIMGQVLAHKLLETGWQVTVFDKHDGFANCSNAAAGLLTPFSELDKADPIICTLGQKSMSHYWPKIIETLPETIYFRKLGSLIVHHPKDHAEWDYFNSKINSVIASEAKQASGLEPELAKFDHAYYFPNEAHIDCQSVLTNLRNYLILRGVQFHLQTEVLHIQPNQLKTNDQNYEYDFVFDCRGLGAKDQFKDLRAVRGELIWLHAPEVSVQRPVRLLHPRYSLYLVPRANSVYIIGASEIEAEDYSPISVRTSLELLTAAYYLHAGFIEARIIKTLSHCRPTLANHNPRIKYTNGLIAVNGLYRHGYLIAPALAAAIVQRVTASKQECLYPEIWEEYDDYYIPQ